MSYEEVLLTGLRATVQNADRNNLTWDIFLGTVVNIGQFALNTYDVICDGDDTVLTIPSLAGTLYTGSRVYIIKVPPNSLYILGATVTMLAAPPSPPSPPLPPPVPSTAELDVGGISPILDIDVSAPEQATLIVVAPVPTVSLGKNTADLVAVGPSAQLSIVSHTLVLEDFFERTVTGLQEWGTPDLGPDWWTVLVDAGQLIQVDGGAGQIINTATYNLDIGVIQTGNTSNALVLTYFSIEVLNIQVDVPAGGLYYDITGRDYNFQLFFEYPGDGTAEVTLTTGLGDIGPEPVPDVTADQPIDVFVMAGNNGRIKVWTALSSVGIDTGDPPLFDAESFVSEGTFTFEFGGFVEDEEASVGFGEIRIWDEPLPPTGLILEDTFSRTVTGLQEWGTPDLGDDWETQSAGTGQIIQVDSGTGQMINGATYDGNTADVKAGTFNIKNYSVEAIGVQADVSSAPNGAGTSIAARDFDNELIIYFLSDGTAEAELYTGITVHGPIPVPDVTATQAIDVYVTCTDDSIQVWTALTSVGLNLSDPPLFDEAAFDGEAGPTNVTFFGGDIEEESSVSYSEIRIWNNG